MFLTRRGAGFAVQRWTALPSVVVGLETAVSEPLSLAVNPLERDPHDVWPSSYRERCCLPVPSFPVYRRSMKVCHQARRRCVRWANFSALQIR